MYFHDELNFNTIIYTNTVVYINNCVKESEQFSIFEKQLLISNFQMSSPTFILVFISLFILLLFIFFHLQAVEFFKIYLDILQSMNY